MRVKPQLFPRDDLKQFFQGATSAGQGNHGVRKMRHRLFPFVHGFDLDQFRQSGMLPALFYHETGNNAGDRSSGFECRVGDGFHQADIACSIDHPNLSFA